MVAEVVAHMVPKGLIQNIELRLAICLGTERLTRDHKEVECNSFIAISEDCRRVITEYRADTPSLKSRICGDLCEDPVQEGNLEGLSVRKGGVINIRDKALQVSEMEHEELYRLVKFRVRVADAALSVESGSHSLERVRDVKIRWLRVRQEITE